MKSLIMWIVIIVVAIEVGGMAFDCLQRNMEADTAALQQGKMEREYAPSPRQKREKSDG